MRRLILILLLILVPVVAFAAEEPAHGEEAHSDVYFGFLPGWVLRTINMLLFFGVLAYFVGGPVKKAFSERSAQIREAAVEARERREKADRMASDIQARLTQIEQEVHSIHERAEAEGERQKRELIAAANAEAEKILATARTEVDNRLKNARKELTEYAGQLAATRAEEILKERITESDQQKLFQDSLRQVTEVQS